MLQMEFLTVYRNLFTPRFVEGLLFTTETNFSWR